ncbi:MAG: tetratricopeptide repeat protein [Bacteroidales bacterium]|nr:tetratricopeptide repeat protein [Bacteroidales bacterium]
MKKVLFLLLWMAVCLPLGAQTAVQRDSVLTEARRLKSIYKTDEALDLLSTLVVPDAFDEQVFAEMADCLFQSGDYEGAQGTYFMLSARVPDSVLYKIRLFQIHSRLRAWPQCIQAGREVLQLDTIPAVLNVMGDSFRQLEQPDSALHYYRRFIAARPMNESVVSKAIGVLLDTGDYDGAVAQAEAFLAEDPDNAVIAPLQGVAYYRKSDYDTAATIFQRQEDIGNDTYPVHYFLGQSYWHTKVIYRAEKELVAAWQIDSTDVNLAYSIAAVKSEAVRDFETEVKPWLDKAWEMVQPDPAFLSRVQQQYGLGYYKMQDSWDKAIEHYKEAYRYNPGFISALSTIAYCYEAKKDYKNALEWYERYLKVARPGSPNYLYVQKSIEHVKGELFMQEGK